MDIDDIILESNDRMEKAVEYLKKELRGIRTGRANTALLEYVKVDYYGSSTDLRELAAVSVSESQQLMVKPFDPGAKNEIVKAIEKAELGLNPQVDGQIIRVPVPALTGERRKELVKKCGAFCEEARIRGRGVRKEYNDIFKKMENDKEITEDDLKRALELVQSATDENMKVLADVAAVKEQEVLDV